LHGDLIANMTHSETKQKTLEEIAAAFGDEVVDVPAAPGVFADKLGVENKIADVVHIEAGH
jgi:hypothetical protein